MSELKACALCGCEAEEIRIHSAAEKEVACTNKLCPLFQLMGISIELWQAPRPAENKIKAEGIREAIDGCVPLPEGHPDDICEFDIGYCEALHALHEYANKLEREKL